MKEIAKENKPYNQVMKEATIRAILRNETYLPESGLYQRIWCDWWCGVGGVNSLREANLS